MLSLKANNLCFMHKNTNTDLFKNISFTLDSNDRAGLIGKNGSGKSTLMNIIYGNDKYYTPGKGGTVERLFPGSAAYFEQNISFPCSTQALDFLWSARPGLKVIRKRMLSFIETGSGDSGIFDEFQENQGYEFETLLSIEAGMLGFSEESLLKKISCFSGGEKTRLAILRLFLTNPGLILLDEPTNHLDIKGIKLLENYLASKRVPMIIVSHDRAFLDNVCNVTWELSKGLLEIKKTCFSRFEELKNQRIENLEKESAARNNKIKQLKKAAAARRNKAVKQENYKAPRSIKKNGGICKRDAALPEPRREQAMMKSAKVFEQKISRIISHEEKKRPIVEKKRRLRIPCPDLKKGFTCLETRKISGIINKKQLFKPLSLSIFQGEKIALIGPNGSGKTSLLKLLTRTNDPAVSLSGDFRWSPQTDFSIYFQENENLDPNKLPLQHFKTSEPEDTRNIRYMLAALAFEEQALEKKTGLLSCGQKAKLGLCRAFYENKGVLILDEPVNHLEISTRTVLEEALVKYAGTVIFVSHDRRFTQKIAQRIIELS